MFKSVRIDIQLYTLKLIQEVPASLEDIWAFFSNPSNLGQLTPAEMRFKIIDPLPEKMYAGMLIRYKISPLWGILMNWTSEISVVENYRYFVDVQVEGPYKFWHHEHRFSPTKNGVEIIDLLYYDIPGGPLGKMFHKPLVKKKLDSIFEFRKRKADQLFGPLNK